MEATDTSTIIDNNLCESLCVNTEKIESVKKNMTAFSKLLDLSELFKVLGDHTRIRILHALLQSELCVCDLSGILDMTQSAISHQLRVLRTSKVVKYRKEGKNVFYSLDDEHIFSILKTGMEHINE